MNKGEIKEGKSSFVNALLGLESLLPTGSDVATSTVYKVIYGPERKGKLFFLPDLDTGRRPEHIVIKEGQIVDHGTENGNPGKKRGDFIGVECPATILKARLIIFDPPGSDFSFLSTTGLGESKVKDILPEVAR